MVTSLRISAWNANGLEHNVQEITLFLNINRIGTLLVSESHTTEHPFVKVPHYTINYANHPDGTTHAGSAIIIKSTLKHYELEPFITNQIQGTAVRLVALSRPMVIAALYSPPRHSTSAEEYNHFLTQPGTYYLVDGVWKANDTARGSRLTNDKGRKLLQIIQQNNLNYFSTGEPTYWPTDANKIPDLLDFAITNRISDLHHYNI
jgi:hypothetical protein